ncbi:oligosaccharide flippase family protein [Synechococcales cyanobacterium C]|uniref:Oligosaccharide flippase family protein n=1 Tax=Petrachloros mirabilis ULC683 TaxID=2781853 RepID=A0A8K2A2A4_9CYAN|nr:lipopolysaccharide biosynthesis protein [Petrachloros mirabilis]NCJ08453.1 oligosaccharide flippase family protein [Petrachloros mirabilis ULC683]
MIARQFKRIFSNPFIHNVGWLGAAEVANRVFRLGTTVILARMFSTQDYGLMAEIYIIHEFSSVLTLRGGIGAKIIQADKTDLEVICHTAYWLNWLLCGTVFLLQCGVAWGLAYFYDDVQLGLQICTVGLIYLMFPTYLVQAALIERDNRLKINAACTALQALVSNIILMGGAIAGFGAWSVVWAMVLGTPVWIVISLWQQPWQPPCQFKLQRWREVIQFSKNLLGIELLGKIRNNSDYFLVGKFLGIDVLGLYYFAYNAGSGFTSAVVSQFMLPLFPYICAVRDNPTAFRQRYWGSFRMIALTLIPLILLQTLLAPVYVPIVFGQRWIPAIPILILICVSILPDTLAWSSTLLLNAMDKSQLSLYFELAFTVIFVIAVLFSVQFGTLSVAITVLTCHLLMQPLFAIYAHRYAFRHQ